MSAAPPHKSLRQRVDQAMVAATVAARADEVREGGEPLPHVAHLEAAGVASLVEALPESEAPGARLPSDFARRAFYATARVFADTLASCVGEEDLRLMAAISAAARRSTAIRVAIAEDTKDDPLLAPEERPTTPPTPPTPPTTDLEIRLDRTERFVGLRWRPLDSKLRTLLTNRVRAELRLQKPSKDAYAAVLKRTSCETVYHKDGSESTRPKLRETRG